MSMITSSTSIRASLGHLILVGMDKIRHAIQIKNSMKLGPFQTMINRTPESIRKLRSGKNETKACDILSKDLTCAMTMIQSVDCNFPIRKILFLCRDSNSISNKRKLFLIKNYT